MLAQGWLLHRAPFRDTWVRSWASLSIEKPQGTQQQGPFLPTLTLSEKENGRSTASLPLHPNCTLSRVAQESSPALLGRFHHTFIFSSLLTPRHIQCVKHQPSARLLPCSLKRATAPFHWYGRQVQAPAVSVHRQQAAAPLLWSCRGMTLAWMLFLRLKSAVVDRKGIDLRTS